MPKMYVGFGAEDTFNDPATVDHFVPHIPPDSVAARIQTEQYPGHYYGEYDEPLEHYRKINGGAGDVQFRVLSREFGFFLGHMLGGTVATIAHPSNTAIVLTGSTTTNGDATVTVSSTAALVTGMGVSGTGIPGGATIASITNGTTLELSANATADGTVSLTFTPVSNDAKRHTFTPGDVTDRSLTYHSNRPYRTGGRNVFRWTGGRVSGWELSQGVPGLLLARLSLLFAGYDDTADRALDSVSYPSGQIFGFGECTVTMDPAGTPIAVPFKTLTVGQTKQMPEDLYNTGYEEPVEAGNRATNLSVRTAWKNRDLYDVAHAALADDALLPVKIVWLTQKKINTAGAGKVDVYGKIELNCDAAWQTTTPQAPQGSNPEMDLTARLQINTVVLDSMDATADA